MIEFYKAGKHLFCCGDIEEDAIEVFVRTFNIKAEFVYSDPPWSKGNAKYWRTMAGNKRDVDIKRFWEKFCHGVLLVAPEFIFIEQGVTHYRDFIEVAHSNNFPRLQNKWKVFYKSGNKLYENVLLFFSDYHLDLDPSGLHGLRMTDCVFNDVKDKVSSVFDPCIGKGMTAKLAHKHDMICYGVELNRKRLNVVLDRFGKYYDVEAI